MLLAEARLGRPLEEVIGDLYVVQGKMQREVAEALGVDTSTVSEWMVRLGIDARSRGAGSIAEAAAL